MSRREGSPGTTETINLHGLANQGIALYSFVVSLLVIRGTFERVNKLWLNNRPRIVSIEF